jgi:uncharacterized protein (TIGR03000 family)
MKRPYVFLVLAVLTLSCKLSVPSKSYAQVPLWGGWGGYGWGGYGMGGYGFGGYRGYSGYPNSYLAAYNMYRPSYYNTTPNYFATRTAIAPVSYVEPVYITTTTASSTPAANQGTRPNRAHIYVNVPATAQVFINDTAMRQKGARREFMTPPLPPNDTGYTYEVTARWTEDSKEHRAKRTIRVTPGGTTSVNFLAAHNPSAAETSPIVPASGTPATPPRKASEGK